MDSLEEDIVRLKGQVEKLKGLLDDPHPGLFTWNDFVRQSLNEIADWVRPIKKV